MVRPTVFVTHGPCAVAKKLSKAVEKKRLKFLVDDSALLAGGGADSCPLCCMPISVNPDNITALNCPGCARTLLITPAKEVRH